MTEYQTQRIIQLEQQLLHLEQRLRESEKKVSELVSLRDQFAGVGAVARWGIKVFAVLAGWGALKFVADVIHWLNMPMSTSR